MKTLERGKDKIKQICDILRVETLEPAKHEAKKIIAEAEKQAQKILQEAEKKAGEFEAAARRNIEKQKEVFHASLIQAAKQGLEALRQDIEHHFFSHELADIIGEPLAHPKVIASLIEAVVKAVEKDGLESDFALVLPKTISADELSKVLAHKVMSKIKEHTITVGQFIGGVQIKLLKQKMTLDLTDDALRELLVAYIRKDFRALIFEAGKGSHHKE